MVQHGAEAAHHAQRILEQVALQAAQLVERQALGRLAALCVVLLGLSWPVRAQEQGTLRIHIALPAADGTLMPVSRHALLISQNPTQAAPRRVLALGAWLQSTACRLDGEHLRWSPLHGDLAEPTQ